MKGILIMKSQKLNLTSIAIMCAVTVLSPLSFADSLKKEAIHMTVDNFTRAESDTMFRQSLQILKLVGASGTGDMGHLRNPTPIAQQPVIRMNRDTLYSAVIIDLTQPVTLTLADVDGRYQSMHVINQDHYMFAESKPGTYTLTQEMVGTRYATVSIRTFVDANDPADIKLANLAQDSIKVTGALKGWEFEAPNWDLEQLTELRQLLSQASLFGLDSGKAYGTKEAVEPVHYLFGSAAGWGSLPKEEAMYDIANVENNDGTPHSVTFKDVPVDHFWSVTVYNEKGYLEENDLGAYSFNNVTADANVDGSYTINFGGCEDDRANCLPITDGWNYALRYYGPQAELLSGEWQYPEIMLVK